jgi:dodecin
MAVARVTKITASSTKSFQDATQDGVERATKSLRGVTGFEVLSLKGKVENGKVTNIAPHWKSRSFWNEAIKFLQLACLIRVIGMSAWGLGCVKT